LLVYILIGLILFILGSGLVVYYQFIHGAEHFSKTNYETYIKYSFNQPQDYPLNQSVSPQLYHPIGTWIGRIILPQKEQRDTVKGVLFEVHHTDSEHQDLVGNIVNLKWSNEPKVQAYVQTVTKDVHFSTQTQESKNQGNLHPVRLNNWLHVDPLESLAGARPDDNVIVMLPEPMVVEEKISDRPTLILTQEPIQITGRFYGLVTIVSPTTKGSDKFLVRHFNPTSKQFDGVEETIRLPQVPADRRGVFRSTNKNIEKSPLNPTGWYIYGAKDAEGIFVAQAIAPRTLFRLQPDEVLLGKKAGISYFNKKYWKDTEAQKGIAKTILLDPTGQQIKESISHWREGDRAIVLHTFGGIGGKKAEPAPLGVVTGHFVYGLAHVVREPLTQELRFDIEYLQVYAHNPDGIVAGKNHWSSYMGDLQRGWLGNRPVSDVLVKLDAVTEDYDFDGIKLSPWNELTRQLQIMMARYRIGDGTGAAIVNPATSCVQDSNQALYVTIKSIEAAIQSNPRIQDWLQRHPDHAQTRRFQRLVKLGRSLERQLVPLGIVRSDWQENAQPLAGTRPPLDALSNFFAALTTWRTVLPRRAHDEIAAIFLKHGASVWLIRTNQVGGFDPDIKPRAPTALLGHRTH
jgi:predicted Abi (CAAX) family protease